MVAIHIDNHVNGWRTRDAPVLDVNSAQVLGSKLHSGFSVSSLQTEDKQCRDHSTQKVAEPGCPYESSFEEASYLLICKDLEVNMIWLALRTGVTDHDRD